MSTKQNEEYLENMRIQFEEARTKKDVKKMDTILQALREDGFDREAKDFQLLIETEVE